MTIQEKRETLAKHDADNCDSWDYATIYDIMLNGCTGYNNMTDEEIEYYHDYIEY